MFRLSAVQAFNRLDFLVSRHSRVLDVRRSGFQPFGFSGVQTFRLLAVQAFRWSDVQAFSRPGFEVFRRSDFQPLRPSGIQTHTAQHVPLEHRADTGDAGQPLQGYDCVRAAAVRSGSISSWWR